jgi:hypothetical protein
MIYRDKVMDRQIIHTVPDLVEAAYRPELKAICRPADIAGRMEWLVPVWEERCQPFFFLVKQGKRVMSWKGFSLRSFSWWVCIPG